MKRSGIAALVAVLLAGAALAADGGLYQVDRIIGKGGVAGKRGEAGDFLHPQNIALDGQDNLYVVDREHDRVQAFRADGTPFMTIGKPWTIVWGSETPTGPEYLRNPYGVTVADGSIYITDWGKHRVLRFGMDGHFIGQWGGESVEHRALHYPNAIYADGTGKIYVGHERVNVGDKTEPMVFDMDGNFLNFDPLPGGNGFVRAPDGSFFQCCQSRVYKIGPDGKLIGWIGRSHLPLHPEIAEQAGQWIPASETYPNGKLGGRWCSAGSGPYEFRSPGALAVDAARKRLFVCDTMNHRVQIFDLDGHYLGVIGERGREEGQFLCPSGIAVATNGDVFVADKYNNRIQVFKPVDQQGAAQ